MATTPQPPQPPVGGGPGPSVPNHLVLAIVSVLCCWPLAIVAIINAAKVNGLVAQGDIAGAETASANAKKWALIAIVLGVAINGISLIASFAMR